ncbi:hypothetical protein CEXT_347701 [Caerostris extrusa]|uniref:WSC domain-containing protein n=1 Tax=Caerostris extrusa TaxID=172846 RepID=A0AAV4SIZ2_CAEEX|nr:hypothetical protein CEXT_347701 [Caerostris extrusa]
MWRYAYRRGGFQSTLCVKRDGGICRGLGSLVHQNYRFCNEACLGNDARYDKSTEKKKRFLKALYARSILGGLGSLVHQNYRFCNEACIGNDVRGDKSTEKKESIEKD